MRASKRKLQVRERRRGDFFHTKTCPRWKIDTKISQPMSLAAKFLLLLMKIFPLFQALMKFPHDYPYSPPSIRFITKVWHPNVYENGDLCISILHPPVDDPQSGELPCERWNPTQNVRTILLSVISLLNEPNTFSPANVDASVMYRRWRDSNGRDNEYPNIIRWLPNRERFLGNSNSPRVASQSSVRLTEIFSPPENKHCRRNQRPKRRASWCRWL